MSIIKENKIVGIPCGETRESFLKCRIENLTRIQDLYFTSIFENSNCFLGPIEANLMRVEYEISTLITQLEDLQ
jgi:hypothetical protein